MSQQTFKTGTLVKNRFKSKLGLLMLPKSSFPDSRTAGMSTRKKDLAKDYFRDSGFKKSNASKQFQ